MHRKPRSRRPLAFAAAGLATLSVTAAMAATIGMVVDDGTKSVTLFDADTFAVLGRAGITPGPAVGDCSITSDQTIAFVTNFQSTIDVIDIPGRVTIPPPIPIANFGEDSSISPDQRYLVVCDGAATQPVSVIDIATRRLIGTFDLGHDCNSVDVCDTGGSVLVTSANTGRVRRLTLDAAGALHDTGESFNASLPNNVICAPGGRSAVVVQFTGTVQSLRIPGLTPMVQRNLTASNGIAGQIHRNGDRLFVLGNQGAGARIDGFTFDAITGDIAPVPNFSIALPNAQTPFFGIDQVAIDPGGARIYASQPSAIRVYSATNGAPLGSITSPSILRPTGICFTQSCARPAVVTPRATPVELWPPSHEHRTVGVTDCIVQAVDGCDGSPIDVAAATSITRVESDEPEDSGGDGATCHDIVIAPDGRSVNLRAERAGGRDGRIYTIHVAVTDRRGNRTLASCQVAVPHDRAGQASVPSGCRYCEGMTCPAGCPGHDLACTP